MDGSTLDQTRSRQLAPLMLIAVIAGLVIAVYRDSYASMAAMWAQSSSYGHGVLIFPISAYLIWRQRNGLAAENVRPWPLAILAVAVLVALWLVSRAVGA